MNEPEKIYFYEVLIEEMHLDSFGHVNNAVYVKLYEQARWDFISKHGLGLEWMKQHQKAPVILDLKVRFKKEITNREIIRIRSKTLEVINGKILRLEQVMLKLDGSISSEAEFTIGFFDLKERKLVSAPEEWMNLF
jgi:YbgC/YbaW family acyl-CoA thioester hydrolase